MEVMISNTRDKLNEAKYFLEHMKENLSDRDAFKYNLSAYLSSARSVTFIMQSEFDKVSGYKEWYSEEQSRMKEDDNMVFFNDKRAMTIHKQPVRPSAHINVGITEQVSIGENFSYVITHDDGTVERGGSESVTPPPPAKTEITSEWLWYFDEFPKKDIVTLCEEHIVKLETLVAECEYRFTS